MLYTEPRYTKDLDIWVEASEENSRRVFRALAQFGAPLAGINQDDFSKKDVIYQLGVAPSRVDVLTSVSGLDFEEAWLRRTEAEFGDVSASFIGLEDLLKNKLSVGPSHRSRQLRTPVGDKKTKVTHPATRRT